MTTRKQRREQLRVEKARAILGVGTTEAGTLSPDQVEQLATLLKPFVAQYQQMMGQAQLVLGAFLTGAGCPSGRVSLDMSTGTVTVRSAKPSPPPTISLDGEGDTVEASPNGKV